MNEGQQQPAQDGQSGQPQTGQVIAPGSQPGSSEQQVPPDAGLAPSLLPEEDRYEQTWGEGPGMSPAGLDGDSVSWTASEFISHEKSAGWYLGLGVVAIVIAAAVYLVTKDLLSSLVMIVAGLVFGVYAGRKPRQLQYGVNASGVQIGEKWYGFDQFRSFAIMQEGAFSSIVFLPLKRFAPLISIYYAPEDEAEIISMLTASLPMEERKHDPIDRLMQRIRF